MKKTIFLLASVALFMFTPLSVSAKDSNARIASVSEQQLGAEQIERRVEEIRGMDRSKLSKEERKGIRQELREMKRQGNSGSMGYGTIFLLVLALLCLIIV